MQNQEGRQSSDSRHESAGGFCNTYGSPWPCSAARRGPALARHLRARGLSCRDLVSPGTLPDWGLITLSDPADLMRVCVLLEGHPPITALAESRDRIDGLWPLFYRVVRSGLPGSGGSVPSRRR